MSYAQIVAGEVTLFKTIVENTLDFEPASIQKFPCLYIVLQSFTVSRGGQATAILYNQRARLALKWQDNERAEQELALLVNQISALLDQNIQLNTAIPRGFVKVTSGLAGYRDIAGTLCRVVDYSLEATEKDEFGAGRI